MPESDPPRSSLSVRVLDHPDRSRYEAYVGHEVAGFVTYRRRPGMVVFVHTEVGAAFQGQGVGGTLASAALRGARALGLRVDPVCPFIARYIEQHPEHRDLVAGPGAAPEA